MKVWKSALKMLCIRLNYGSCVYQVQLWDNFSRIPKSGPLGLRHPDCLFPALEKGIMCLGGLSEQRRMARRLGWRGLVVFATCLGRAWGSKTAFPLKPLKRWMSLLAPWGLPGEGGEQLSHRGWWVNPHPPPSVSAAPFPHCILASTAATPSLKAWPSLLQSPAHRATPMEKVKKSGKRCVPFLQPCPLPDPCHLLTHVSPLFFTVPGGHQGSLSHNSVGQFQEVQS